MRHIKKARKPPWKKKHINKKPSMEIRIERLLKQNLKPEQVKTVLGMMFQSEAGSATRKTVLKLLKQGKFPKYTKVFLKLLNNNSSR